MRFLVVGAGSWGTAFTRLLLDREHEVVLACRTAAAGEDDRRDRLEPAPPPARRPARRRGDRARGRSCGRRGHRRGKSRARRSSDVVEALPGEAPILSLAKGLDPKTGQTLSTRVRGRSVAVLSGPNMAEEIAAGLPTAAVIASEDGYLARAAPARAQLDALPHRTSTPMSSASSCARPRRTSSRSRPAVSTACGSATTRRRPSSRAASRRWPASAEAAGARPETFSGLAGIGDLAPPRASAPTAATATPASSSRRDSRRSRRVAAIGQTVEGLTTAPDPPRPRAPARRRAADHRRRVCGSLGQEPRRPRRRVDGQGPDGGVV